MKVIHVPFCFYPDPGGGTEVYVEALAHHLRERDVQVVIAAPGECDALYARNGLRVQRFAVSQTISNLRDLYGEGDNRAAQEFGCILDDERPDMVHLHALTRGASLRLVREAKYRRIPVLFTYHTPTVSCQRGTLMHWGTHVCDGLLDIRRCVACTLNGLGLNKPLSVVLGGLPSAVGGLAALAGLSGGFWTALRMTELMQLRHSTFRALMAEVDHIVALCQWVKDLLLRNGVSAEKITVSRHGLPQRLEGWEAGKLEGYETRRENGQDQKSDERPSIHASQHPSVLASQPPSEPPAPGPFRIVFLGRLDPTKGPDVLIRALRLLPEAPLELHLYGIVQGAAGAAYLQQLKALAVGDPRIAFLSPVPSDGIISLLRRYHLLAVPSRWLETGPLVVLEAFAAGIPVIGSNLGGIAELVEHEVNGLLVEPDSPEAWCQTLRRLSEDRGLLMQLRAGIRPPRGMQEVAEEMVALYRTILEAGSWRAGKLDSRQAMAAQHSVPLAYKPSRFLV